MGIRATIHALRPETQLTGPFLDTLELDKAWHGIHYLLCGSGEGGSGIEGFLLNGHRIEEGGDAEVFYHSPQNVTAFAELLYHSPANLLRQRFNGDHMDTLNIYPESRWNQTALDYLIEYYERLREFASKHALEENALLVVII
jgi:hypothetical protein